MEQATTLEFGSSLYHPHLGWTYRLAAYTDCLCHKKPTDPAEPVWATVSRWWGWCFCHSSGFRGGVARAELCWHRSYLHSSLVETASPGTTKTTPTGLTWTHWCPSTTLGPPGSVTFFCPWAAPGPSRHQLTRVPVCPSAIWGCSNLVPNKIRTFHQGFQGKTTKNS